MVGRVDLLFIVIDTGNLPLRRYKEGSIWGKSHATADVEYLAPGVAPGY